MALYAGHFSKSKYDKCKYPEDVYDSTAPYEYITNQDSIYNCGGCLTTYGPISSYMGIGVSTTTGDMTAAAQQNIDIDSIMSNRNVPVSKCKKGKVNPINVTKLKLKHVPICNGKLDSQHSKMTDPAMFYRGAAINRFYDLNRDPQANIFYDWAVNTDLEMKDNYTQELPIPLTDVDLVPNRNKSNRWKPCSIPIKKNGNCGTSC